ncbi:MAG TPA: hypothetical protein VJQ55_03690 [Candidatus Binatia bacterium]|nr:hypothetical protein [Candidatus Binatia bacterium]
MKSTATQDQDGYRLRYDELGRYDALGGELDKAGFIDQAYGGKMVER